MFQDMELSYILGNGSPKNLLIFQEGTLRAQKIKKTHSEKTSYISENGKNFLYSWITPGFVP